MLRDALASYGLNKNEIVVFLALVEQGGAFAKELVDKTKFHKNIIYDNLNKLKEKGLVSEALVDNKKFFVCESPDIIDEYITKTHEKFTQHSKDIAELKTIIQSKRIEPSKTSTRMFTGVEGVRQIIRHELDVGKDYFVIGAPKESVDIMGAYFWEQFVTKQKELDMKGKMIFNESLRDFAQQVHAGVNEIRFLKGAIEPLTEIIIYDKFVATIVWSKEPVGTLIENEQVAQSYRSYFDILWKQTKK